ncbi:membrane protein [Brevifollis gellanilyticus]|uniref:Membrane protein n=2 Tax=Brevifollis gellanilyticus TaxID=748831 RepID=A0A512M334_9BACT|nr:membrane protein [Brevifollis gellanilyticus]
MIVTISIIALCGLLFVILETFLPGGIAGFLGVLCILAAVILAMMADELDPWSPMERTALAFGIVAGASVVSLIWLRFFAVKFWSRSLTLKAEVPAPKADANCPNDSEGTSLTELRPLGRAEIDGRRYEVRCQDGFAPVGARLRVTGHEPGNLVVRLIS